MALNIRIDFNNRYEHSLVGKDLRLSTFESILIDGTTVKLGIRISTKEHPLMTGVYNLSFGPLNDKLEIDDLARLTHKDHSKVFSTIVFAGLAFLEKHKGKYLGIDGTDTARAYMYYRCIQNNYEYLNTIFDIYGVKYYSRVLRNGRNEYNGDCVAVPISIDPKKFIHPQELFNYFIFKKKKIN